MRKIVIAGCLLALILLIPSAVSANGYIVINSTPSGAAITVDNGYLGPTPDNRSYTTGTHSVALRLAGYVDYTTSVNVVENSTSVIDYTFQASAPTITSITPSSGYNNSAVSITSLAGTGFVSGATVVLAMTDQTNITGTSVSVGSSSQMTCTFDITGKQAGTWSVIVTNPNGRSGTYSGFSIKNPSSTATLSSITPSTGKANSTVTITDLDGTGFISTATILLRRSSYNDIPGSVSSVNTPGTVLAGSFNLNNRVPGDYQVCIYNDATTYTCGLTFTITSDISTNGTISIKSAPTNSKVYLGSVYKGYTPLTLDTIPPGTYSVMIQRAGYYDWSGTVKVTSGNTSSVAADLQLKPDETPVATTTQKTTVATVKTTVKSSLKVPTPWPSATPTPASPVDPLLTAGAVGVGLCLVTLRK
jgi:hypothetical protein